MNTDQKPNYLDAVILLSGVNFSSVTKVVAALQAIADKEGKQLPEGFRPCDMPTTPYLADREPTRGRVTADYVASLIEEGFTDRYSGLDIAASRFRHDRP